MSESPTGVTCQGSSVWGSGVWGSGEIQPYPIAQNMVSEWKNSSLLKQLEKVLIDKIDIFIDSIAAFGAILTDPDTAEAGIP